MTVPSAPHLLAVVAVLAADGLGVGLADATGLSAPYVIVWPLGHDGAHGPPTPDGRHADARLRFQVTAVAGSARGALELADRTAELLTAGLTVSGRGTHLTFTGAIAVDIDRTVEPAVYVGGGRWEVWTTPAGGAP